jgi:lysophospholipase L1-like esterase
MQGVGVLLTYNITLTLTLTLLAVTAFGGTPESDTYLALGDSIAFGMNPLLLPPFAPGLPTPDKFVGYPEAFAAMTNLPADRLANAACPGETSASFLNQNMPDLGCNSSHVDPAAPPFKSLGLHEAYTGSQMDFALAKLAQNSRIILVTLTIGAYDVLMALPQIQACGNDAACAAAKLGAVLDAYADNLTTILTGIRKKYRGTLIMTKYYSPAPALDAVTVALNTTMTKVAAGLAAIPGFAPIHFADGFTAFKIAALGQGGDACAAGLLIRFTPTVCDVHPSSKGRELLAFLVLLSQFTNH